MYWLKLILLADIGGLELDKIIANGYVDSEENTISLSAKDILKLKFANNKFLEIKR